MSASPVEVVGQWLQNLLDPAVVTSVVAPDAADENVGVFGDFRYKSNSLGKVASFRSDGSWTVQTQAGAEPFQV
jgi:hypothetical protein